MRIAKVIAACCLAGRMIARKHLHEDDAERPGVRVLIDGFAKDLFRSRYGSVPEVLRLCVALGEAMTRAMPKSTIFATFLW